MRTFEEYEKDALATALYPKRGQNVIYPALGLCGEAGEFAEKVKKELRDREGKFEDPKVIHQMLLELGDVLWYLTAASNELGVTLADIAELNIRKLHSRRDRDKIHGDGDER